MLKCLKFALSPLLVFGCAAGPSSASAPQAGAARPLPQRSAPAHANLPQLLLERHNEQRRAAGVPPLVWDAKLAIGAAAYARSLSLTGELVHSPRAGRPGIGENLWVGTVGRFAPDAGIASWAAERADFRDGVFPGVSRTGNWLDVSHYTQMIWRTTTHVGCGLVRSIRWEALVCRYSPKGNRDGQRPR